MAEFIQSVSTGLAPMHPAAQCVAVFFLGLIGLLAVGAILVAFWLFLRFLLDTL